MAAFERGDIVRVPFPYADRPTRQQRPALVVSIGGIGENDGLLWVVMITSAGNRHWPGDIPLDPADRDTGLPAPSVVRPCKLATIEARSAMPLGRAPATVMTTLEWTLRRYLGLGETR